MHRHPCPAIDDPLLTGEDHGQRARPVARTTLQAMLASAFEDGHASACLHTTAQACNTTRKQAFAQGLTAGMAIGGAVMFGLTWAAIALF